METRFAVFFALLSVAMAAKFTMPLKKTPDLRGRLIKEGGYKQFLEGQRTESLKAVSQKMSNILDEFYLIEIFLGTPSQKFSVALDTCSSNLWVVDINCTSKNCKGNASSGTLKHLYNSTASRTFYPGVPFYLPYEGGDLYGSLGSDVLKMAEFTIWNQDFGNAKSVPDIYTKQPVDGVLGLGFPDFAFVSTKTPMQNIVPQLDAPLIAMWLEKQEEGKGQTGKITYGGIDDNECSKTVQYVPLSNNYTWEFFIDAVEVGTYSRVKKEVATPATGSGWTGVPTVVFSGIVKQTKALYDWNNEIYTVPCSTMQTQPDIFIVIHGITYAIKSEEYVIDLKLKNGQCALAFFGTTHDPAWILGDAFLRSYCHVFDFGNSRIGLARSIHGI